MLTKLVKRALFRPICDIGQLTLQEKKELDSAVRKGYLSKGKGGPFPVIKTMYARPNFDFISDRQKEIQRMMRLAELDKKK
jgi:hypothetical protein